MSKNYIKHLKEAKRRGYEVALIFLWLVSPAEAVKRVAQRRVQGGHHIPEQTIIRRYYAGIQNLLKWYLPLATTAYIMNNSSEHSLKRLIARKNKNGSMEIFDKKTWEELEKTADDR